jgi:signal transduction histidine kinase
MLTAMLLAAPTAPAAAAPVQLEQVEIARVAADGSRGAWQPVHLPDSWDRIHPPRSGRAVYRLALRIDQPPAESYAIYLPRAGNRLEVRLNGELLARFGDLDRAGADYRKLPLMVHVPARLLRVGTNPVEIEIAAEAGQLGGLARVWAGPESEIEPVYAGHLRWLELGSVVVGSACLVLGLLALGVGWRIRDRLFAVFGVASLVWSLRMLHVLIVEPPLPLGLWNALISAAYGWYIALICLFALDALAIETPRLRRALALFAAGTTLAAAWAYLRPAPQVWTAWIFVMFAMCGAVGASIVARTVRTPRVEGILLSLSAAIGIAAGARDYIYYRRAAEGYEHFSITRYVVLAFLLAMAWILVDRFARAMRAEAEASRMLARRVEEKERELAQNYQRLRTLERERVMTEERQRIMQNMHDGLGSQLLTSLALVERGAVDRRGMAQLLREAIDDMRLAIDTLAPGRGGLLESLGNLRYRLEPRFRAAGIELRFVQHAVPEHIEVPPDTALQILRILQESLTNALKHARPARVLVELSFLPEPSRLSLAVTDDGAGFDVGTVRRGRGLSGMRRRAQSIGATLDVTSGPAGTRIVLDWPIPDTS